MKFVKASWRLIVGVLFVIYAVSSLAALDIVGVIVALQKNKKQIENRTEK